MYTLRIKNNYKYPVAADSQTIDTSKELEYPKSLGNLIISIPGSGEINLIDIGNSNIIETPLKQTWKVLISYQGNEIVFGYEGEGSLFVEINELGQAVLKSDGEMCRLKIPSFILPNDRKINS
ncbi:MAG: hypothetical protein ACEPO8_01545 [Rhodothermaceae bacterium]